MAKNKSERKSTQIVSISMDIDLINKKWLKIPRYYRSKFICFLLSRAKKADLDDFLSEFENQSLVD